MDGRQWFDGYRARLAELGGRLAASEAALGAVEGTATSPDGAVTIGVDAAGAPHRVGFGPAADALGRAELAAAVLDTARRARADAGRQARAVVQPLVRPGSAALRMIDDQLGAEPGGRP